MKHLRSGVTRRPTGHGPGLRLCLAVAAMLMAGAASSPAPLEAHDLGVAKVLLREIAEGRYRLQAKLPPGYSAEAPGIPSSLRGPR